MIKDKRLTYLQSKDTPERLLENLTAAELAALVRAASAELRDQSSEEAYTVNGSTDMVQTTRSAVSRVDTVTLEGGSLSGQPASLTITGSDYDGEWIRSNAFGDTYNGQPYFVLDGESEEDPSGNPDYTIYHDGSQWVWNGDGAYAYSTDDLDIDGPDLEFALPNTATSKTIKVTIGSNELLAGYKSVTASGTDYDGDYDRVNSFGDTFKGKPYYLLSGRPLVECVPGLGSNQTIYWDGSAWRWNGIGPYAYSEEDVDTPVDVTTWYLVSDDSEISGFTFNGSFCTIQVPGYDEFVAGSDYNEGDGTDVLAALLNGIDPAITAVDNEDGTITVTLLAGTDLNNVEITSTDLRLSTFTEALGTDDTVIDISLTVNPATVTIGNWTGTAGADFPADATPAQLVTAIEDASTAIDSPAPQGGVDGDDLVITYSPGYNALSLPSSTDLNFSSVLTTPGADTKIVYSSPTENAVTAIQSGLNTSSGQVAVETTGTPQPMLVNSVDRRYIDPESSTTDHTDTLPVVTTIWDGWSVAIRNASTVDVTITSSGSDTVQVFKPGSYGLIRKIPGATATDESSWEVFYVPPTGTIRSISLDDTTYTTTVADVGCAFDATGIDPVTLIIDDMLAYEDSPVWTGSNMSTVDMTVTLDDSPSNLIKSDGTTGSVTVGQYGSFVVRRLADSTTYLITGTNLS